MAKIELSVEELVKMMAGEDSLELRKVKKNLSKLLLDAWLADPQFKVEVEERARELAEKEVERHIGRAFSETKTGWGSPKRSFNGWAAEVVKGLFDNELATLKSVRTEGQMMKGATIYHLVQEAARSELEEQSRLYKKTLEDAKPFIDEEVRKLIPKYVTEEYRDRVAANFDEKRVPAMLTDMVQKTIGAMLVNGALQIGNLRGQPHE